uniref:Decapping nuclease n=1 Tax=Tetranychus urticae TaxID=32264 RepID=T1KE37_TETUR
METVRKECLDLKLLPETSAVKFNGPKKIAYFSTYFDKENKEVYCPDNSSQRYLVSTALKERINCLEGFNPESNKWLPPDPKWQWRNFMRWIGDNDEIIQSLTPQNDSQQQIDFICTNAMLKHIMLSLYQDYDWIIHAFRIRSEIFLYFTRDNRAKKGLKSPYDPKKTKMLSYSRLNVIRKITKPVKEREFNSSSETDFFSIILFSKVGQHRILHTGLTEFVMSKGDVDKPNNQASYAALKLMHNLFKGRNGGFNIPFYRRMFWWASALVSGVETLICGDLDEFYSVKKFKVIPPSNLDTEYHAEAQKKCLITLDKILLFIKSAVQEKNKVYDFHLDAETKEVVVSPSEKPIEAFVPPWNASEDIPEQEKS